MSASDPLQTLVIHSTNGCMRLLALLIICGLSGCAPAGIPAGATPHWELKGGRYWTWVRPLEGGCAAWTAKQDWASVQLRVRSKCKSGPTNGYLEGQGLSYLSFEDELVFSGYWPWSQEEHFKLLVFDEAGMLKDVLPCPYSLSAQQIDAMRVVAREAVADARTDSERRVLNRVAQRLAMLGGGNLASGQSGCSDRDDAVESIDVWISH